MYALRTDGFRALLWFTGLLLLPGAAAACTVSATGVAFGLYDPLGSSAVDSLGEVEVTCPDSTAYNITLSEGQGSFSNRHLINASNDVLAYNLFTDATYQFVWGDGAAGNESVSGSANNTGTLHSVHGRIPGGQNIPAGSYNDTIVVTVTY